jgi:hypothetical protein
VPSPFWLDVILLEVLFVRNPLCLNVCFCLKSFLFKWNFVRLPISWTMKENIPSVILKQIDGAFSCLVHTLGQAASRTNRNVCSRTKVEQRFLLRHSIRLEKMPRLTWVDSDLASGWPDMFEKSHPKCFAEINTYIFCTVEKVAQWFALKKLTKVNNHPRGENSTNQVTLLGLLKNILIGWENLVSSRVQEKGLSDWNQTPLPMAVADRFLAWGGLLKEWSWGVALSSSAAWVVPLF